MLCRSLVLVLLKSLKCKDFNKMSCHDIVVAFKKMISLLNPLKYCYGS